MIVKNESHIIERCLNSVKDIVNTIVISDTGSTDNTVELINTFLETHSKKIKGRCEVCGEKMGDEIHHLQPQCEADADGYLQSGWVHKNHPANLMSVCERCHDDIHSISSCSELSTSVQKTPHKTMTRKKTTKGYTFV